MVKKMGSDFEWDEKKHLANQRKHGVSFFHAQRAFADPQRLILHDIAHSTADEPRYYCIGRVEGNILTVRFVWRAKKIRMIGAGYWRKGRKLYETQNQNR